MNIIARSSLHSMCVWYAAGGLAFTVHTQIENPFKAELLYDKEVTLRGWDLTGKEGKQPSQLKISFYTLIASVLHKA